ncbi:MAG: GDP-L-fucose synthase [Arcobacter sp.]|nr:GDP-L-fucose synthase [Arcobacter sp.]
MKKRLSILGAGWLGLSLAKKLKNDFKIKVSIKDDYKKQKIMNYDLESYILNENNFNFLDNLLDTDYLFINFPPSKFINYVSFLEKIYSNKHINNIEKIIFISSTSIYPNEEGVYTELCNIQKTTSRPVYESENYIINKTDLIFRCAGLMGYDRIPGKYFSGISLDCEDVKVNYVHKDDVIEAIRFSIEKDLNGIFNLCSNIHPSKKEIYIKNSKIFGFIKPIFINKKEYKNRIINAEKIESYGFKYKYPNPLEYFNY